MSDELPLIYVVTKIAVYRHEIRGYRVTVDEAKAFAEQCTYAPNPADSDSWYQDDDGHHSFDVVEVSATGERLIGSWKRPRMPTVERVERSWLRSRTAAAAAGPPLSPRPAVWTDAP